MSLPGENPEVRSREDLAEFIRKASRDLEENPDSWENSTLKDFLLAWAAWLDDMPGWFRNQGKEVPEQPDWGLVRSMVLAARVYE